VARRPYTADRAYRVSVRPLAGFMVIAGLLFPVISILAPEPPYIPFTVTPIAKRIWMAVLSVPFLPIGVGLWRKLKLAWYGMFGYFLGGTILHLVALGFCTPAKEGGGALLALSLVLFDVLLIVGLYFVTRPVFTASHESEACP